MAVTYTIQNICPKKSFSSEEDLRAYCETHPVPTNFAYTKFNEFLITKTVTEEFTLPGLVLDIVIDKNLCVDLIHNLANDFNHNYINFARECTPFNSYYYGVEDNKVIKNWIIDFLKNVKAEHIVECLDVHTNYKPCNSFAIHINTCNDALINEYVEKYNKKHGTKYQCYYDLPIRHKLISKVCGGPVNPASVDFSTWTEEELEAYHILVEPRKLYIQFRNNDIMIDSIYYTGHHVSHRQNNLMGFDKKRYDWCMDCVCGNFKKFK